MKPDDKRLIAALAMLSDGRATVSDIARLLKTSQQRVYNWITRRRIDVMKARRRWLMQEWAKQLKASEVETADVGAGPAPSRAKRRNSC